MQMPIKPIKSKKKKKELLKKSIKISLNPKIAKFWACLFCLNNSPKPKKIHIRMI